MDEDIDPHVLLVEDDVFLAHIYKEAFEKNNFKVSVAENGEAGLRDAVRKLPDVIMLDIVLPKLDGFSVLQALKKSKQTKKIPVIILTSLGQRAEVEQGFALGAEDYIIKKQMTPDEIVERVNELIKSNN